MIEKRLRSFGLLGIISLLSYTAMVVFSPLAYPGYDWLSMAVSDLGAKGAPSEELANQLNALFGPCGLVSIMAVCIAVVGCNSKLLKIGIYSFAAMEWICNVGYKLFPWVKDAPASNPQNIMHLIVTILVVVFSLAALILIAVGAAKEPIKSLSIWAIVCLIVMIIGPIGTAVLPKAVFGLFERFSTFSTVTFNAILGIYLIRGDFVKSFTIRSIKDNERQEALSLVWNVFTKYEAPDYSKEGIKEFYKSIHDKDYLSKLCMYGAFKNDKLVGVIATRKEGTHIALFFVDGNYHRQGIGKKLFQTICNDCHCNKMTVNSSPYAIPVYHKLGFRDVDKEQVVHGLRFTPMEYSFYKINNKAE